MFTIRLFASNYFESDKISFSIEPGLERRFVSSAKRTNCPSVNERGRSLIYRRNRIGPWAEPCGTPWVIDMGSERWRDMVSFKLHMISTRCNIFCRYDENQLSSWP